MKKLLVTVFIFFLGTGFAFSQDIISSEIKEVTLFTNQALITKGADVKVKKGMNELLIGVDAFNVDRDSISVKVYGEGEVFSVQFKEIYLKEAPQENIKVLEQKIKELKDRKRRLLDEKSVLGKKEEFLDSLIEFSQTQVPQEIKTSFPKTEDLEKTLVFLGDSFQDINRKKEALDLEIEEIDKEIGVLEKELASIKRPRGETKRAIEVLFNSKRDQEIRLEASYIVYNAYWRPLYKVNVPLDLKEVDLIMFSNIRQKTGEDWKGINLTISNVIPLKGVALPSLNSWFLDLVRHEAKARRRMFAPQQKFASRKALEEGIALEAEKTKEEADFVYAQRKELPLSFEYSLPQILNIESKDKETILPIFSKKLKGEFFHYVVPRISPLTFLVCKTSSDKELLSGPLNVYFGGRFIGKTYLSEKKPGEDFNLSLGADREVKVKREKIKDKVKETFFGKIKRQTIVREMAFKITVENLKEKTIKINIIDSIPVSKTDMIEVKDLKINPKPSKKDYQDREGVLFWELEVNPKEKEEIDIEFTVTYPKDTPIFGL